MTAPAVLDDAAARAKVVEAIEGGATMAEAAQLLGVTRQTLSRAKGRWPDFAERLDRATAERKAKDAAMRAAARRERHAAGGAVAVKPKREVIEPELVDSVPEARPDRAADHPDMLGRDEYFRLLAADARDPFCPGHKTAMLIFERYHLGGEMLAELLKIKRDGEIVGEEQPRALVIRKPYNGTHEGR